MKLHQTVPGGGGSFANGNSGGNAGGNNSNSFCLSEISCEVCQVSVNSSHQLQAHLAGKSASFTEEIIRICYFFPAKIMHVSSFLQGHRHRIRCLRKGINPAATAMVTPFSSSGPSRSPSECSFNQQAQQQPQQPQQQHNQQPQQPQHKQQPNRSNGIKPDGNKEAAAKAVAKSSGGGASDRRQQNGNNPGKQQQQQPPHPSSAPRGQQLQQHRRPQQPQQPPPLLSLMSMGLQNKSTSLLGFPQPGGVPIVPQEIRMSLLGNPVPTLPGVAAAKGLNVKMHPVCRAVVGGDAKAHGGGGSAAEGAKGGRGKGAGGKINTGPLVNKSEVNGGANSSKFSRLHFRRWYRMI